MYALITGASSGIGRELAILLAQRGYHLILVARREKNLQSLKKQLEKKYPIQVVVEVLDLSKAENCKELMQRHQDKKLEILINNAGFGKVGNFENIPLEVEEEMIQTNITALHILTKLFLQQRDHGYILNVASIAAFQPGPLLATYSATKAYVLSLGRAVNYELQIVKKPISVTTLCPGPVDTEFNEVAGTTFQLPSITARQCAKAALRGMFAKKEVVYPNASTQLLRIGSKLTPSILMQPIEYYIQTWKQKK